MQHRGANGTSGTSLADEIERQIRDGAFLPGHVVASEQALQTRSNVGRAVVRQAVRLLEQRGVASMRRGVGGGLTVLAPDGETAARTLSIAIERRLHSYAELDGLRRANDTYLFCSASNNIDHAQLTVLRDLASKLITMPAEEFAETHGHRRLVVAFYKAFNDAAGMLLFRTSMECGLDFIPTVVNVSEERLRERFWQLTLQSVEAAIAGDIASLFAIRAEQEMFFAQSVEWRQTDRAETDPAETLSGLKGERLSREILRDIRAAGWTEGTRLGGYAELACSLWLQRGNVARGDPHPGRELCRAHVARQNRRTGGRLAGPRKGNYACLIVSAGREVSASQGEKASAPDPDGSDRPGRAPE